MSSRLVLLLSAAAAQELRLAALFWSAPMLRSGQDQRMMGAPSPNPNSLLCSPQDLLDKFAYGMGLNTEAGFKEHAISWFAYGCCS